MRASFLWTRQEQNPTRCVLAMLWEVKPLKVQLAPLPPHPRLRGFLFACRIWGETCRSTRVCCDRSPFWMRNWAFRWIPARHSKL